MITPERWEEAVAQLERIERYFDKQWLDGDFPVDAIWDAFMDKPHSEPVQED